MRQTLPKLNFRREKIIFLQTTPGRLYLPKPPTGIATFFPAKKQEMAEQPDQDPSEKGRLWHAMEIEEALEILSATEDGLNAEEVRRRLEEVGANRLPKAESRPAWKRFLYQFHNVLIYVLLVAAAVTALMNEWVDTWLILGVVLLNAITGYVQEGKAEQALDQIRKMLSLHCRVVRDGQKQDIDAEELVPGDIVELESGDKVPADLRLIRLRNLRIEESALTGESEAVEKQTSPVQPDAVPGDRTCIAFSGTSVVQGRAAGVVVETGENTELGKINRMMSDVQELTTPLIRMINDFGKTLTLVILALTGVLFLFGWVIHSFPLDDLFMAMISLAVAAIPEGLPAVMTITLAIGVRAMAGRNAIIRRLPSVETLGSVTVICSDKTGTLTRNEMTVRTLVTAGTAWKVEGVGYEPEGSIRPAEDGEGADFEKDTLLRELIRSLRICNDAKLLRKEDEWTIEGDPTEGALLTLARKAGMEETEERRLDQIPFESYHQYMATLNDTGNAHYIFMKGAPEKLLELCSRQLAGQGEEELDREYWASVIHREAEQGQRLIASAMKQTAAGKESLGSEDVEEGMVFLGIAAMIDPPREEAIEAIEICKNAGIRVLMITGDHLLTAKAIGAELGIGDGKEAISGEELETMDDRQFREAARKSDIFARTSPEHKLRLVRALQEDNQICAMTGDGVNDAPALKRADVGIAMGVKGTEVTKEASEMVLADDNFATIANAVKQGRTIYDNLRKSILFLLPTSGAEALVIMAAILAGLTLPITPVQILWINMVTAVTLGIALAFEPAEQGVMDRKPRDPDERILDGYFIWKIAYVSVVMAGLTLFYFYRFAGSGGDIDTGRTVAINVLAVCELFFLYNCRKIYRPVLGKGFLENRIVFVVSALLILLQLFYTYAPFMNRWFQSVPLTLTEWLWPAAAGIVLFLVVELEKRLLGIRVEKKGRQEKSRQAGTG